MWTNLKAENEKQKSSWGAKVRKRVEKKHLETERENRERFGLTGIMNHGPKSSFKGLNLAGGSC